MPGHPVVQPQTQQQTPPCRILHQAATQPSAASSNRHCRDLRPKSISGRKPPGFLSAPEKTTEKSRRSRRYKNPNRSAGTAAMPTDRGNPRSPLPEEKRNTRSAESEDPQTTPSASSSTPGTPPSRWGWSSGHLIPRRGTTTTRAPLAENLLLPLSTGPTRGPEVLLTSRRRSGGRRQGEPQDSPADDGGKEAASLFASLNCSEGKRGGERFYLQLNI